MRVKITTRDATVYRFADQTVADISEGVFRGRLASRLDVARTTSDFGSTLATISFKLINGDAIIPAGVDLWNAAVEVITKNGYVWAGKITAYESSSAGELSVTATEQTVREMVRYLPDELAHLVTLDENVHSSAIDVVIPTVIGGTPDDPITVKGILRHKTDAIYYLCNGEIHDVVSIRAGDKTMTRAEAAELGYIAHTGAASQEREPGIAYIQITDPGLRKNDDGSYVEISAKVIGLKLGNHTVTECRNGARFLLWLLKTADIGPGGWGLGIAESEIDLASFSDAIAAVDAAGLKLDGVMYDQRLAQNWINEICRAIRGSYEIGSDGKRRLYIDAPGNSSYTYEKNDVELIRSGVGAFTGRVFNSGRLDHSYNPLTGLFMQAAFYEDAVSITQIDNQVFEGQSYFIRDAATAQKILEYTCKRSLIGAQEIAFQTRFLPEKCRPGMLITFNYPERGLSGLWRITKLITGDQISRIDAKKYDPSIFTSGATTQAVNWTDDPPIVSPVTPGQASGLTLSSEVRPSPDGTNIVVLKGSFFPPTSGYLAATIEYAQGVLPILNWTDLGLMRGKNFEIPGVKPGQPYTVRIRMVSANSKSSSYTTGTLTTEGDTVPPGKPAISATSSLKNVSINLSLAPVPSDMAGFQVFRNVANNSATATQIGYVESTKGIAQTVDLNTEYGFSYYYWAKAIDTWGNSSVFSDAFGPLTISMILNNDVSPEAIKQAIGSVASWSAKNCTTASIAEANGVKDVSGNGNHGQAFGGVTVVDAGLGKTFQFDGKNDYIDTGSESLANGLFADSSKTWSVVLFASTGNLAGTMIGRAGANSSNRTFMLFIDNAIPGSLSVNVRGVVTIIETNTSNSFDHIGITWDGATAKAYKNGNFVKNLGVGTAAEESGQRIIIGARTNGTGFFYNGQIFDPRFYSRALSATEIKTLYMFPGDAAFGRITADLVAAGTMQALIAQIAEAFIQDAHIVNVNAAKLTAGFINAARYEGGSITVDKLKVGKAGAALNDDPNFEDSTAWTLQAGQIIFSTVNDGKVGIKTLRSGGTGAGWAFCAKSIPVDTAKTYRVRLWVRKTSVASGTLYVSWRTFNAAGTAIPTNLGYYLASGVSPGTAWTEYSFFVGAGTPWPATSDARTMKIGLGLNYNGTAGYMEAQDFRIEEVLPETLIQDGAVTTNKLTTNQIIGKDFRTAANVGSDVSGVKFTGAGIEAWKNGTRTVLIDSNGNAVFSGDISGATGAFAGQVQAGKLIIAPTNGFANYGVWGRSSYTGYFSVYVGPLGTLSQGTYVYTRIKVQIGSLTMEIGGSRELRAGGNTWSSDSYVKVLTGKPNASQVTVRFKTSTSGTTGFFIVIGNNNDWGVGNCTVIEAVNAIGTLTLANANGTTNYTRYAATQNGVVVAWACFNAIGSLAIVNSAGISSITDNGVGDYTLNFDNALTSANYAVTTGEGSFNGVPSNVSVVMGVRSDNGTSPTLKTTTQLRLASGSAANGAAYDNNNLSVLITL